MDLTRPDDQRAWAALERLLQVAKNDTGQARRVANFLLAWHNAEENGGWDPVDLWNVDDAIAEDMLTVMHALNGAPNGLSAAKMTAAQYGQADDHRRAIRFERAAGDGGKAPGTGAEAAEGRYLDRRDCSG